MRKLKNLFCVLAFILAVEFVLVLCTISGIIKPPFDFSKSNASVDGSANVEQSYEGLDQSSSGVGGGGSSVGGESFVQDVSSPLSITLSGSYLTAYQNSVKGLGNSTSDRNKRLVVKIGLQILQSKVIKYENKLHFYGLGYSASGGTAAAKFYSLKDCIDRINAGKRIYTDCFGFVRLSHSIAAYSINPSDPGSVFGIGGLYGYVGSYTGAKLDSLNKLGAGTIIYDRLTGPGDRHVAMYLYTTSDGTVHYMDQGGLKTGTHTGSYIYSPVSKPYKFNTFKNYC